MAALSVDRQADDERGSAADLGLEVDRSAVLFDHDGVGDRESLAGPLADVLGGEEEVEDPGADFLGDARAGVLDADFRPGVVAARADGDDAFAVGAVAAWLRRWRGRR